jgi:hypothetical protein
MSKYITEFQQNGPSVVNVDLVCKDWGDRFSIITWVCEKNYTLIINGKRKKTIELKTEISKKQAIEIIVKLNLIFVKSILINSAGRYHSKDFILSEIERFKEIKEDKEKDLSLIAELIFLYQRVI